jgi:4'-phosphopantetheinyl transferase
LTLRGDEVHVWRARLDGPSARTRELLSALSPDERERAWRFHFTKDRDHFVVARGLLRSILGLYLGREPGQLRFGYGPHGKPYLIGENDQDGLRFNLSHSHGLALLVVARARQVGVDVERVRPDIAGDGIAERFFSPQEVARLRALPAALQAEAFFNCWTRKEAYIKARGEGLSLPLDQFDVSLAPGEPAALLATRIDAEEASRWSLMALAPGPGFAAALAAEGSGWRLKCWQWSH